MHGMRSDKIRMERSARFRQASSKLPSAYSTKVGTGFVIRIRASYELEHFPPPRFQAKWNPVSRKMLWTCHHRRMMPGMKVLRLALISTCCLVLTDRAQAQTSLTPPSE